MYYLSSESETQHDKELPSSKSQTEFDDQNLQYMKKLSNKPDA